MSWKRKISLRPRLPYSPSCRWPALWPTGTALVATIWGPMWSLTFWIGNVFNVPQERRTQRQGVFPSKLGFFLDGIEIWLIKVPWKHASNTASASPSTWPQPKPTSGLLAFGFLSLINCLPKNHWTSHSPNESQVDCLVPARSNQTPWPDIHTGRPLCLSSSLDLLTITTPALQPVGTPPMGAGKPYPFMTRQASSRAVGLFTLILVTPNRLSRYWGFNEREVIPVHTQPALGRMSGSKKVLPECYVDPWMNKWMNRQMSLWVSEWTNEWMND